MKAKDNFWVFVIGLIISIISVIAAFLRINFWYFPAVIGFWLLFDYFSSKINKNTAFQLLIKSKYEFLKLYLIMFMLGCTLEIFGRFIFNLWFYPPYTSAICDIANLLFYPFILFSFREMYEAIRIVAKNKFISFIVAMLLGILIWEVPNTFSGDWIYTIPYVKLEIFKINIIVIIGWAILIVFPIWIYDEFFGGRR